MLTHKKNSLINATLQLEAKAYNELADSGERAEIKLLTAILRNTTSIKKLINNS